ncbi:universal stress protein [Acrocarpospora catenulata]|uniref:universal stress protein n=1 Tax=Acrocarpospora catenulata TaxID=2836182 RepID=UPI001BDACCCB|nr:universal stress protein [Acrocarpospora catenulata]
MREVIVVGVDGSPAALQAVEWAAEDAVRARLPLRIVYAVDRSPYQIVKFPDSRLEDLLDQHARRVLTDAEEAAHLRYPGLAVTIETINGRPADVLRAEAAEATELVVGSRGLGGFAGTLVGSVSMHVAGQTPGAVVVVRSRPEHERGEVVVGVDDSPICEPALTYAFTQARQRGCTLRALHAWQLPVYAYAPEIAYELDEIAKTRQEAVNASLASCREKYPEVKVAEDIRHEHPVGALVAASAKADLVVVGSHGRSTLGAVVLGSVSRGVLHHAKCPVAVVRATE